MAGKTWAKATMNWDTVKPPTPSAFPRDGAALDLMDKAISGPIFRLKLGLVLECVLSVPGCFFGMPSTMSIGPGLIAVMVATKVRTLPLLLLGVAVTALVARWAYCLRSANGATAWVFYAPKVFLVAPLIGTVLAYSITDDPRALHAGSFYLLSWFVSVLPILTLKSLAHRRRPIASESAHLGEATAAAGRSKALGLICFMLRTGDANASFPSGDVAGSVSFAYPLWRCQGAGAGAAVLIVLSSAFGRMYWHAHHAMDVSAAALIAFLCCTALDVSLSDAAGKGGCPAVAWYHPFVALLAIAVQQFFMPQKIASGQKH